LVFYGGPLKRVSLEIQQHQRVASGHQQQEPRLYCTLREISPQPPAVFIFFDNQKRIIFVKKVTMTNEEKVQYWVTLSDEDLSVAATMLQNKHYLYVGFMCHQAIEKIFKAAYTKLKTDTPPFTHKLSYLAQQSSFEEQLSEEQKEFIDVLDPLNIKTRYPDYKNQLAQRLTQPKCAEILEQTKILQQWTKEKLL
jgi:HEPN domain-containing protein